MALMAFFTFWQFENFTIGQRIWAILGVSLVKVNEPVSEKTNDLGSDQVRYKPVTEDG